MSEHRGSCVGSGKLRIHPRANHATELALARMACDWCLHPPRLIEVGRQLHGEARATGVCSRCTTQLSEAEHVHLLIELPWLFACGDPRAADAEVSA